MKKDAPTPVHTWLVMLKAMQALRFPLPSAPDQIDRLIMDKPDDNGPACHDYRFSPRCFLEYLESR